MHLADFLDAETLVALEPEELALRMLPVIETFSKPLTLHDFLITAGRTASLGTSTVRLAIREAWAWLEGNALLIAEDRPGRSDPHLHRTLSRRGSMIARARDPVGAYAPRLLRKESLHPKIREDVWALFHRGKYDTAVFEAMKAVEVYVREATALPDGMLGTKLMREAFKPEGGILTDESVESGERTARMELFAGTIGSYKNPQSHRNVDLSDPNEAAEIIFLANHLLRIVDSQLPTAAIKQVFKHKLEIDFGDFQDP